VKKDDTKMLIGPLIKGDSPGKLFYNLSGASGSAAEIAPFQREKERKRERESID
jgi:hypothetical protein